MTSFRFGFSARTHRSVIHNCKTSGDRVSHPMSILTNNLLRRNPCLLAELFKNLLKRWVTFIIFVSVVSLMYSILQPNLDPEDSNVSFTTKVLRFSVLFTYCQVTKSNWTNLTDFGQRRKSPFNNSILAVILARTSPLLSRNVSY